jgi:hypothetical protein
LTDYSEQFNTLVSTSALETSHDVELAKVLHLWPKSSLQQSNIGHFQKLVKLRWDRLRDTQGQKFELDVEKQRAQWAALCAEIAEMAQSVLGLAKLVSVEEIVELINVFDIPSLGKNKHDKSVGVLRASSMVKLTNRSVEITSTAELFIRSTLSLLGQTILSSTEDKKVQ